jgi:hypothetical protein
MQDMLIMFPKGTRITLCWLASCHDHLVHLIVPTIQGLSGFQIVSRVSSTQSCPNFESNTRVTCVNGDIIIFTREYVVLVRVFILLGTVFSILSYFTMQVFFVSP